MLKSKNSEKQRLRSIYVSLRKEFNQECQRTKRRHLNSVQLEIQSLEETSSTEFWRKIGKIGVGKERQNQIPMEVILPNGDIS